jgi:hypothetical protein
MISGACIAPSLLLPAFTGTRHDVAACIRALCSDVTRHRLPFFASFCDATSPRRLLLSAISGPPLFHSLHVPSPLPLPSDTKLLRPFAFRAT